MPTLPLSSLGVVHISSEEKEPLYDHKQDVLGWYRGTQSVDTDYVLSDQNWNAQEMVALYFEKTYFCPRTQADYGTLIGRFYANDTSRFAWAPARDSRIEPRLQNAAFHVRRVDEFMYEIVPVGWAGQI